MLCLSRVIWFAFAVLNLFPCLCCAQGQRRGLHPSSLYGRVTSPNRRPAVQATVIAYRHMVAEGVATLTQGCRVQTDANGSYECRDLSPGNYSIEALPVPNRLPKEGECILSATFYPNLASPIPSGTVTLGPDQLLPLDLGLRCSHAQSIHLHLQRPMLNATFSAMMKTEWGDIPIPIAPQYDASSGLLTVGLEMPGDYTVSADWTEGTYTHHASGTIDTPSPVTLEMEEWREHTVEGTVSCSTCVEGTVPKEVQLLGIGTSTERTYHAVIAHGTFRFQRVRPGEYLAAVSDGLAVSVRTVTVSGKEADGLHLFVPNLDDIGRVTLDLGRATSAVGGHLSFMNSGDGSAGVVLQSIRTGQVWMCPVNMQGEFRFSSLPSGSYSLYGFQNIASARFRELTYLQRFAYESVSVEIVEGSLTERVELSPIS